jgi:hypothetical protein
VTATGVLVTLLLAPAASGAAAAPACETFARGSATLPMLVGEWFGHSSDERVVKCPQAGPPGREGATALYFGEGALTQHGAVCKYPRHGLTLTGTGAAARLQRYDRSEALAMALAGPGACPKPHDPASAQGYIETYDVSTSSFEGIMRLWSAITTSATSNSSGTDATRSATAAAARVRLQAELGARTGDVTVTRIVRIPGSVLRRRYALFVKAPQPPGGGASQYVIYMDKGIRGPYEITAFAETN